MMVNNATSKLVAGAFALALGGLAAAPAMAQMMTQFTAWNSQQREAIREVELLGDSMIRELARLHAQIALLEANLQNAANPPEARAAEADLRPLSPQPTSRAA